MSPENGATLVRQSAPYGSPILITLRSKVSGHAIVWRRFFLRQRRRFELAVGREHGAARSVVRRRVPVTFALESSEEPVVSVLEVLEVSVRARGYSIAGARGSARLDLRRARTGVDDRALATENGTARVAWGAAECCQRAARQRDQPSSAAGRDKKRRNASDDTTRNGEAADHIRRMSDAVRSDRDIGQSSGGSRLRPCGGRKVGANSPMWAVRWGFLGS